MLPCVTSLLPFMRTGRSPNVFWIYLHRFLYMSIINRTRIRRFSLLLQSNGIVSHLMNMKRLSTKLRFRMRTGMNGEWRFVINNNVVFCVSSPNFPSRNSPESSSFTRRDCWNRNFHGDCAWHHLISIGIAAFVHVCVCVCSGSMCLRIEARVVQTEEYIPGQEKMREAYYEVYYSEVHIELSKLVYLDIVWNNLKDMLWTFKMFQKFESSLKVYYPLCQCHKSGCIARRGP